MRTFRHTDGNAGIAFIRPAAEHDVPQDVYGALLTDGAKGFLTSIAAAFNDRVIQLVDSRPQPEQCQLNFNVDTKDIRYRQLLKSNCSTLSKPATESPLKDDPSWRVDFSNRTDPASNRLRDSLKVHQVVSVDDPEALLTAMTSNIADGLQIDFDDAHCPSYGNTMMALNTLREFCHTASFTRKSPVLGIRPRSMHIMDSHVIFNEKLLSGALFDYSMFIYHNADALAANDFMNGPLFYLPKVQIRDDVDLWADIFAFTEQLIPVLQGRIRCIAMIENVRAAFETHEILYSLRQFCIGLNLGKFDYIFSFIKLFPNEVQVSRDRLSPVNQPYLRACQDVIVQTCGVRCAIPTTGMFACMEPSQSTLKMAYDAKRDEARFGSQGALVSHHGFITTVKAAFTDGAEESMQYFRTMQKSLTSRTQAELVRVRTVEDHGIRKADVLKCVRVVASICCSWLEEMGGTVVDGYFEDLATAELSRCLLWQWCHFKVPLQLENAIHAGDMINSYLEEMQIPGMEFNSLSVIKNLIRQYVFSDEIRPYLTDGLLKYIPDSNLST
uniref:malate synthase n=1 Tax=Spongospora subterranea TaxID=70186 RepID=A0A0H5RAJ6_9EUKA|eukprot:CRZ10682.1 hypothetical protein [Spongospora subterranea]